VWSWLRSRRSRNPTDRPPSGCSSTRTRGRYSGVGRSGRRFCSVSGKQDVGVWRVSAQGAPRLLERVGLDAIPELFRRNAERWRPQAVHRAKSLGQVQKGYQQDFVDLGLMPAIKHEVEEKLDRLLRRVVEELMAGLDGDIEEAVFRYDISIARSEDPARLRAPAAVTWRNAPVAKILDGIERYYGSGDCRPRLGAASRIRR